MKNNNKRDLMNRIVGSFKSLLILLVGLFFVGKTIKDDYEKYHRTYAQVPIKAIHKIDNEEFELTEFAIREAELKGRESGGVELYENQNDSMSKATIIVDDIPDFIEVFHEKHKVIARQFEGVHQGSRKVVKEYVANNNLRQTNGELKTIFIYEEYFSWKTAWWLYSLMLVAILFLVMIILSRIKVY